MRCSSKKAVRSFRNSKLGRWFSDGGQPDWDCVQPLHVEELESRVMLATFWVDGSTGNDANDGTFENPFATIQRGIDAAHYNSGADSICVRPGWYNENLSISDSDAVSLKGKGATPDDVVVDGNYGDALYIYDSPEVTVYNMRFTYGDQGIRAEYVGLLTLTHVYANWNYDDGLDVEYTDTVKILHSAFKYNWDDGADIMDTTKVYALGSYFNNNHENGLELIYNENVTLNEVVARYNGDEKEEVVGFETGADDDDASLRTLSIFSEMNGSGVYAAGNEYICLKHGNYSDNQFDGAFFADSGKIKLINNKFTYNGEDGTDAEGFYDVYSVGGKFNDNGDDGMEMEGKFSEPAAFSNGKSYYYGPYNQLRVYGGWFLNNYEEGLDIDWTKKIVLDGLDVQWNGDGEDDNGISIYGSYSLRMAGLFVNDNWDDGVDATSVDKIRAFGITSIYNGEAGFGIDGAKNVEIHGGYFAHNGETGMELKGDGEIRIYSLKIFGAVSEWNYGAGLEIDWVKYAEIWGGAYLHNEYHGIYVTNIYHLMLEGVASEHNYGYGLKVIGNDPDDVATAFGGYGGSTYVEVWHGSYSWNYDGGIRIFSTGFDYYNENYHSSMLDVKLHHVVVKYNDDGHGAWIGNDVIVGPGDYGYGSGPFVTYVEVIGGYYGYNGGDGIRVGGGLDFYEGGGGVQQVMIEARFVDVVSEFNDNIGLHIAGNTYVDGPSAPSGFVNGNDGFVGTTVEVIRGLYFHNGYDGINITSFGGYLNGQYGPYGYEVPQVLLDHVVSKHNYGHGLKFQGGVFHSYGEGGGGAYNGYGLPKLLEVIGGVYNHNDYDGVSVWVFNNFTWDAWGGYGISSCVSFIDVIAEWNYGNGLTVGGDGNNVGNTFVPAGGTYVDIVRGNYNENGYDGINISHVAFASLYHTVGVHNGGWGLQLCYVGDWDLDSTVFEHNGSGNVNIKT